MVSEVPALPPGAAMGCLPRAAKVGAREKFRIASDVMDTIPRSEWRDRLATHKPLAKHNHVIYYQNGEGSCASNAAIKVGVEVPRSVMGLPFVHMASSSLYKQVNRGQDAGSAVDDNLQALIDVGCVSTDLWGGELGWEKPYPAGFKEEAARFQIDEVWDITTFDELISANFYGFGVAGGVWWKDDRRRPGGHAIAFLDPVYENGRWGCRGPNSWGENWGDDGFFTLWEPQIAEGIGYFGAFAPRVSTYWDG